MRRSIMLRGKAKGERDQHEADGSLFLRRENEDLATDFCRRLSLHSARGLT